jgi:hypothetical protein
MTRDEHYRQIDQAARDRFAAQAMAILTLDEEWNKSWCEGSLPHFASQAYDIADAMMAERARRNALKRG